MKYERYRFSWWRRSSLVARWGRIFLFALFLLLLALQMRGQSVNTEVLNSIEASAIDSLEASAQLKQALKQRNLSRQDLEKNYAELIIQRKDSELILQNRITNLTMQLNDSENQSRTLLLEIEKLTNLSDKLRQDSLELSQAFDNYRQEMRKQVGELEFWNTVLTWLLMLCGLLASGETAYILLTK